MSKPWKSERWKERLATGVCWMLWLGLLVYAERCYRG